MVAAKIISATSFRDIVEKGMLKLGKEGQVKVMCDEIVVDDDEVVRYIVQEKKGVPLVFHYIVSWYNNA